MADSKKTGTRKGRGAVKPATIDLKAKDVGAGKAGTASASKAATARSGAAKPATTRTETTKSAPVKSAAAKTVSAPAAAKAADPKPAEKSAETTSPAPAGETPARDPKSARASAAGSGRPQGFAPRRGKERERERASVGMTPFAIAGGIGAVGAMAVMLAALWLGLLPAGNGASGDVDALRSDLDQRIAALESEQTSLASSIADGPGTGDLEARIATLEDRPAVSADGGVDLGPLETALADQRAAIAEIAAALSGATGAIDSVTERTAALESEIGAALAGIGDADGALLASLRERLEAAEQSLASLGETIDAAADQRSASGGEIAGLSDAIAALREQDTALQARAEGLAGEIAALTARIDETETQLGANDPGRTARALAIGRVSEALARGGDLGPALTAFEQTLPEGQTLPDVLTAAAERGLATPAEIAAAFPLAVDAILDASRAGEDASIGARLLDNARSVIRIRPVGAVEGDTPEAIVSRIEAGLVAGDLSGAHAEWRSLPEPARTASADWGAMIGARLEARAALDALAADILAPPSGESG